MKDTYAQRGVSADKQDVHFAIRNLDKGLYPNAFCKILPDLTVGDADWCSIMHADGTGTKSSLAYLYWRETGDLSVWEGIAQDAIVMNTDDMLCAGATGPFVFSSTIGRNSFHIPREVLATILNGAEAFNDTMRTYGVDIVNAGGETADTGDVVRTLIYDATLFVRLKRSQVIANDGFRPGSVIVGLSSSGQAAWEKTYNSGIGSNGLTNARHDALANRYATAYPESFDGANVPEALVYRGAYAVTDRFEDAPLDAGRLLLSPTRTYLPLMVRVLEQYRDQIHGLIHCTGGGQTKCLKFVHGLRVVKDNLLPTPPVFRMIQQASGSEWRDMYRFFNMGHRLEVYTDEQTAPRIIEMAQSLGIEAQVVGRVLADSQPGLTLESAYGTFEYKGE